MVERVGALSWLRACAAAAHLLMVPVCSVTSIAGEGPPAEPVPTSAPAAPTAAEPSDAGADQGTTRLGTAVDTTHAVIEQNILEQVIRLDNFFGTLKPENPPKTEYQIRWRNSIRVEQNGRIGLGSTLGMNIKLPKTDERLRFVLSGDNEPAPLSPSLPQEPGSSGLDRNSPSTRIVNSELRYSIIRTPSLDAFIGGGVLIHIPPEAFVRGRFQYTHKISDVALLRCGETLFVKKFEGLGETTEITLERALDRKTLLRWANAGTVSYEIKGMEWGTELSLIRELSPRSGMTLTGGVYGKTSAMGAVENYRILSRYRRNFLRSWLFYELEPEISWPRRIDGSFSANLALTFRLEVMFQGKEK